MKKQTPFESFFDQPREFVDGPLVLSREKYNKLQALTIFSVEIHNHQLSYKGRRLIDYKLSDIHEDRVRYCAPDLDGGKGLAWWLGASGKGSKPVWTLTLQWLWE